MSTEPTDHQVVGVDGSPGSKHALAWAIARSAQLGPVQPVAAWSYPWWSLVPSGLTPSVAPNEQEFDEVTRRLVDQSLEGLDHENVLEPAIVHGPAGDALVDAGRSAALIVVGTRGHGTLTSALVGSVSNHCVNHATVPVAVVPAEVPVEDRFNRVVVGYDGSPAGEKALTWALTNTAPSTEIVVVHVWSPSTTATAQTSSMAHDHLSAESQELVDAAVAGHAGSDAVGDRRLVARSESGDARDKLRTLAEEADLAIVGARGHGGVGYLLLGSVSSALVNHPASATVVVR